jgi:hypothetical protein
MARSGNNVIVFWMVTSAITRNHDLLTKWAGNDLVIGSQMLGNEKGRSAPERLANWIATSLSICSGISIYRPRSIPR